MPPTEATENRIQDVILAGLKLIGGAPTSGWLVLSAPFVDAGLPADPVPDTPKYQVYLQAIRSEMQDGDATSTSRMIQAVYQVACCSRDADPTVALRMLFNLKADVLRAIHSLEPVFLSPPWGRGIWIRNFTYHADASSAGLAIGVQELFVDVEISTAMP